jgi:hypothetical protein
VKYEKFLYQLEDDKKIYAIIPLFSKNSTPNEPYIVLSQTFLITKNSNSSLILKLLTDKVDKTCDLYDID